MTVEVNWDEIKELRFAYVCSCRAFEVADQVYKDAEKPRQETYQMMCDARKDLEFAMFASEEDRAAKKLRDEHLAEQEAAAKIAAELEASNEN